MVLPDLLAPGLRLVLCGTAPSRASKQANAYYAKPGNLFWPTLHKIGLTPRRLWPHEYAELLTWGIGLTDLNKTEWGSDADLSGFDVAGFAAKMRLFRPRVIALDSKTAGAAFLGRPITACGRQPEAFQDMPVFVLPSPSGRARRFWDERPWFELAEFAR